MSPSEKSPRIVATSGRLGPLGPFVRLTFHPSNYQRYNHAQAELVPQLTTLYDAQYYLGTRLGPSFNYTTMLSACTQSMLHSYTQQYTEGVLTAVSMFSRTSRRFV